MAKENGPEESEIKDTAGLVEDLGYHSLDLVEFKMSVEESFNITVPEEDAEQLQTVRQWVSYVSAKAELN
jgi:acyl carrier protein